MLKRVNLNSDANAKDLEQKLSKIGASSFTVPTFVRTGEVNPALAKLMGLKNSAAAEEANNYSSNVGYKKAETPTTSSHKFDNLSNANSFSSRLSGLNLKPKESHDYWKKDENASEENELKTLFNSLRDKSNNLENKTTNFSDVSHNQSSLKKDSTNFFNKDSNSSVNKYNQEQASSNYEASYTHKAEPFQNTSQLLNNLKSERNNLGVNTISKLENEVNNQVINNKINSLDGKYNSILSQMSYFETILSEIKDFKQKSLSKLDESLIIPVYIKKNIEILQDSYGEIALVLKNLVEKFTDFTYHHGSNHAHEAKINMLAENIAKISFDLKNISSDYSSIFAYLSGMENNLSYKIEKVANNGNTKNHQELILQIEKNLDILGTKLIAEFNDIQQELNTNIVNASTNSTSYLNKIINGIDHLSENSLNNDSIVKLKDVFNSIEAGNLSDIGILLKDLEQKVNYLNITKDDQYNDTKKLIAEMVSRVEQKVDFHANNNSNELLKQFKDWYNEVKLENSALGKEKEDLYKAVLEKLNSVNEENASNGSKVIEQLDHKVNNLMQKQEISTNLLEEIKLNINKVPEKKIEENSKEANPEILTKLVSEMTSINNVNANILKEQNSFTEKMYGDMQNIKKSIIDLIATQKNDAVARGETYVKEAKVALSKDTANKIVTNTVQNNQATSNVEAKKSASNHDDIKTSNVKMAINKLREALDLDDSPFGSPQLRKDHRTIDEILGEQQVASKPVHSVADANKIEEVNSKAVEVQKPEYIKPVIEKTTVPPVSKDIDKKSDKDTFVVDNSIFFK